MKTNNLATVTATARKKAVSSAYKPYSSIDPLTTGILTQLVKG